MTLEKVLRPALDWSNLVPDEIAEIFPSENSNRINILEQEIHVKDEYLQTTLEEMDTSNEELSSGFIPRKEPDHDW